MSGKERLRRRLRRGGREQEPDGAAPDERADNAGPAASGADPPLVPSAHRPTPQDLAGLTGAFALTAGVHDPDPIDPQPDDSPTERGLRGLVGSGSSQVSVAAALRARDASRPREDDLAAAEAQLVIVRRGWVPRDDLPRPVRR
jgi:hypothetical protein